MAKFKGSRRAVAGVEGAAELMAKFDKLEFNMQKDILEYATQGGAEIIQREMIHRAPVDEGVLRSNIIVKQVGGKRARKDAIATFSVGPNRKAAHAIPLELGHNLVKVLKDGSRKIIGHVTPRPFMRPAYQAKKREVIRFIGEMVKHMTDQVARG